MYDIVLADDETWELIGLKKLIARSQLPLRVVGEAENGIVALQELEEKRPQILITDIRMPGLSGVQLLQQVQEKGLDVDVIILSGYAEFSYAQAALRYGAKDYLLKPVEPERLQEALGPLKRLSPICRTKSPMERVSSPRISGERLVTHRMRARSSSNSKGLTK